MAVAGGTESDERRGSSGGQALPFLRVASTPRVVRHVTFVVWVMSYDSDRWYPGG